MADDPKVHFVGPSCPIPISQYPHVLMAHGGGGQLTHQLIERLFVPAFANAALGARHDGARVDIEGCQLAFTTDSYVVRPLFFPGGDIGTLAINGTVNDLAMCGARPLYLSAGFILEEGLPMETLWRVVSSMKAAAEAAGVALVTGDTKVVDRGKGDGLYVNDLAMCGARPLYLSAGFILEEGLPMETLWRVVSSMKAAAEAAGVALVTGDTKVVDRGKGDGLYVNTAGIGIVDYDRPIAPGAVAPGDAILISGDIGRHGMAIMAVREGLQFESSIESDCAPLAEPVLALIDAGIEVHCLRDLTRGGLASALVEIAEASALHLDVREADIPVREDVRGACEILGFDPLYVANEGRFVAFVKGSDAERAVELLTRHDVCAGARAIGTTDEAPAGLVTMRSRIGATRIVDMLSGEQLPRIC